MQSYSNDYAEMEKKILVGLGEYRMRAGVILCIPYRIFILLRASSKKVRIRSTAASATLPGRATASKLRKLANEVVADTELF